MDLKELTTDELNVLAEEIVDAIAEAKAREKAEATVEKEVRAEKFRGELEDGDKVSFLYGTKNVLCEGTIVRVSEKSVTVESDVFSKGKNYVRFDRFVEVLEKAPVNEAPAEDFLDEALAEAI